MNKKHALVSAVLAAACLIPAAGMAANGEVVWVLTGTASEADGSAVRIAVRDANAAQSEAQQPARPEMPADVSPAARTAEAPAAAQTPTEEAPAETAPTKTAAAPETSSVIAPETVPAAVKAPAAETAAAPAVSTERVSSGKAAAAESNGEEAPSPADNDLAAQQRADMDRREAASLAALEAMKAEGTAAEETNAEPAVSQEAPASEETAQEAEKADENAPSDEEEKGSAEEGQDMSISPANPMVVKADAMAYRGTTGDVDVRGNVDITHMQDRYQTEHVYGNSNTQQYVLPERVKWTSPGNEMTAERGTYDGKTSTATFDGIKGWNKDKYYYEGESGVYDRAANKAVVQKGYFTTKHAVAKVPDYRIEADSIDIYPGDHYTAHNARLYVKNTKILSMSSYSGSLDRDGNAVSMWTLIPVPDYESDNGFGLKNRIEIPIGGPESDLAFYTRLAWYSDAGFKPDVGFKWDTMPGTFKLRYAKEESTVNDDHVWIEMWPEFSFDSRHYYIPHTNFYVGASGDIGHWKEGSVSGSHKQWNAYLSHDPITLGSHLTFGWSLGYRKDYYGYDDSTRSNRYYSLGLDGKFGIWSPWVHYWDNDMSGHTPYEYDTYDMEKPLYTGVKVQVTPLDALSVEYAIDTIDGHTEHKYFTYYRDLHSFTSWVRYDTVDDDFEFMIQPKDFRF